jgi:molybdopterin synthase sulfur carrier subunit
VRLGLDYFAWVRERMGCDSEMVDVPEDVGTVAALIDWLAARDDRGAAAFAERHRIRAACDDVMASPDTPLAGVTRVALFPPVTGG